MFDTLGMVLVYGFVLGSLYLLISLGFSLICGVLRVFHMGYGITFVVAVYSVWFFMKEFGWGLWPAILGMLVIQGLFTLVVVYLPIVKRYREREELLLTSLLLVSLIVEEATNYRYPIVSGVSIPTTIMQGTSRIGSATIPNQFLFAAAIAILITAAFVVFLLKTKAGLIIRAVSQNTESAELMGANVALVYPMAMLLSVIPPTICILVIAPVWSIDPTLGSPLLQTAILVAILGGLGNIRGSIMASFIVGFVAAAVQFMVNPRLANLAILVMVLLVLIFKPQGLARSESVW